MTLFELWFSQGICPVVGLLGRMVVLFLIFKGASILFALVAVSIYIPTNTARWVRGLMRTTLSFPSTLISFDYSFVHLLGLFLAQLEMIVGTEKNAWEIGNFFP